MRVKYKAKALFVKRIFETSDLCLFLSFVFILFYQIGQRYVEKILFSEYYFQHTKFGVNVE